MPSRRARPPERPRGRAGRRGGTGSGVTVVEAFHYPFHPLFLRVCELIASGAVREPMRVDTVLRMAAPPDSDPRWDLALAGGHDGSRLLLSLALPASAGGCASWAASGPLPYDVADTVPQAKLIDAAYRAAGLDPRPSLEP